MTRPVVRLLLTAAAALCLGSTQAHASDPPPTPFVYVHCYDVAFVLIDHTPTVSVCSPLTG